MRKVVVICCELGRHRNSLCVARDAYSPSVRKQPRNKNKTKLLMLCYAVDDDCSFRVIRGLGLPAYRAVIEGNARIRVRGSN